MSQSSPPVPHTFSSLVFLTSAGASTLMGGSYIGLGLFSLYAFGAGVAGEGFCVVSVFDGLGWTAVDAGHAVGAVFSPDRGSVFQMDVV